MTGRRYRMALTGALIVSLFVAGWASHRTNRFLEARSVEQRESDGEIGPLPDGKTLHVASLGFERVLADLFWIRTLYYVGDDYAARAGYPSAERLAQLVTDID